MLKNSPVDPNAFREFYRKELIDILDSCPGSGKALVLDPRLSSPISLIAEYSLLKEHGVDKIYHLTDEELDTECLTVMYMCRPEFEYMKYISSHVRSHRKVSKRTAFFLYFIPARSTVCERILEDEGVIGDLSVSEFHLDMFPLEADLLSLEMNSGFKDLYYEGDYTCLSWIASALMKMQAINGVIPRFIGKGEYSKRLADMLMRLRAEMSDEKAFEGNEIDGLIILDRNVDLTTPLLTQLTYEGLVDEVFGINNSMVELEPKASGTKDKRKYVVNGGDLLFREIRDLNFSVIGQALNRMARQINENYEARHQAKSVSQLKEFIGKLGDIQKQHQSLQLHTNVTEFITKQAFGEDFHKILAAQQNVLAEFDTREVIEVLEDLIFKNADIYEVLRLLCLLSIDGYYVKPKQMESLKQEILHGYGFSHFASLDILSHVGLLRGGQKAAFPLLKKSFRLLVDDVDEQNPKDASYVYSGYAPLTVRLVEAWMKEMLSEVGPTSIIKTYEDSLKSLPGPLFDIRQRAISEKMAKNKRRVIVVTLIGGVTFAEVSALRFLAKNSEPECEIIILTTKVLNGKTLIRSLVEVDKRPKPLSGSCKR